MFSTSSQRRNWIFASEKALADVRQDANRYYIEDTDSHHAEDEGHIFPKIIDKDVILNAKDEEEIRFYYEIRLLQFCRDFRFQKSEISIPLFVQYTAMAYLKRFYLCTSVMDYHPADMYLVCIYVACKTEEFNIAMPDFEENIGRHFDFDPESPDDCAAVADLSRMILSFELILMAKLNYDLIIYMPLKPLEGFLLDIRTRFSGQFSDVDSLKPAAYRFVTLSMLTDVVLLFSPSQIALAALLNAADNDNASDKISRYMKEVLCQNQPTNDVNNLFQAVEEIAKIISKSRAEWALHFIEDSETTSTGDTTFSNWIESSIDGILDRLKNCRNPENDYLTEQYSKRFNDTAFSDDD